ncbi:MAG: non-ribosomal peptide synthetase, partial [Gammaproteobacteria bacterium]
MDTAVKGTTAGGETLEFPVSFAQRRLWFLEQLEGANAAYNVRLPVRLIGALDPDRLQAAVNLLVERHESLRTRFAVRHGEPIQQIGEAASVEVTLLDMPEASPDAIRTRLGRLANWNFDIEAGPLLQVFLIRETADRHTLLLLTHHMISDAWSSGVLFSDLMKLYAGLGRGSRPELPELPVQYADYAVWQREWLAGPELQRQLEYWQQTLEGAAPLLDLPTDRPRPPRQSYRGSRWALNLDRPLLQALRTLAVDQSATLYMVLLSAFYVLLSRYAGQRDVVVGSPIAGRQRTELENLVGFFANTLALRADCDPQLSFSGFLRQVRKTSLASFAHQDLPFERLVEALQPARRLSYSTIFQVMFVLQNAPWEAEEIEELSFSPAEMAPGDSAKYDLTLSIAEADDGLWASFEYNTDLFDAATVQRFASAYESLLRGLVADPDCALMDLPLQAPASLQAEQSAWNDTGKPGLVGTELAAMLADAGASHAARNALSCGGQRFTYAQVRTAATLLSKQLQGVGVLPNTPVAICMQRSAGMVIAMLACLDCEAPYVPLDPGYPRARLGYMLADSGAAVLITDEPDNFAGFSGVLLRVSSGGELVEQRAGDQLPVPLDDSEQLAYLIYTSGSTGQPKGVKLTATSVLNFLQSMAREPGMQAGDKMLAVTTLCFDISVLEILLPLMVGAEVILAPAQAQTDGHALAALLDESGATVMQATPATWKLLLGSGWSGDGRLRILCGGEALDRSLASRLLMAGSELWNLYGPTETTVWSTSARITDANGRISAGRPIANTRLWVVDDLLRPLPARVPGELLIGGAGLSCGYHQRDDLTAEKFVSLPATGERVYRTGDRARWRSDGELELLGRLDTQV